MSDLVSNLDYMDFNPNIHGWILIKNNANSDNSSDAGVMYWEPSTASARRGVNGSGLTSVLKMASSPVTGGRPPLGTATSVTRPVPPPSGVRFMPGTLVRTISNKTNKPMPSINESMNSDT